VQVYDPTDSSGVQGVSITWATQAPSAVDGHPLNATTVTDNFGIAKTLWVLRDDQGNPIPPSNIAKRMFATASVGQVEFQASVSPGRVCSVGQKDTTSVAVGTILADSIRVLDCNGFPVPSAIVTNVASAGGTVSASTDTTDQNGVARLTWTTSGTLGVQTMTATACKKADPYNNTIGVPDPTFCASMGRQQTVVAGAANSVILSGANPASPQAAGSIVPITVIVRDAYGNLVSGQTVTFAASNSGTTPGTVSSASVTTGSGGTASIVWTLGNSGTNTLSVTAGAAAPLTVTVTVP
jgi:hypothetical protein